MPHGKGYHHHRSHDTGDAFRTHDLPLLLAMIDGGTSGK
jgi:hypothetical protein